MASTKENDYILDNDKEAKRLSDNHECIKYFMQGQLIRAPLNVIANSNLRILDSGTSDGTWLVDVQSSLPPSTTLVGTDIATDRLPKTGSRGPNVEFRIQDVHEAWPEESKESFDLVHQRLVLAASGPRAPAVITSLCALVKPGGSIQLIEGDLEYAGDDPKTHKQFVNLLREVFERFGMEAEKGLAPQMAGWLRDAGMVNVQEEVIPYMIGRKMPNDDLRAQGVEAMGTATEGIVGFAKTWPEGPKSIPKEELEGFVERYKAEMYETGGYFPLRVVWGQKPE